MSTTTTTERVYVTRTPGVLGGKPCIAGHRISVQQIAIYTEECGYSPDEIVRMHPSLDLAEVYGALAFYFDNKKEIDDSIVASDKFVEELRKQTGPGPYEAMLLKEQEANAAVPS